MTIKHWWLSLLLLVISCYFCLGTSCDSSSFSVNAETRVQFASGQSQKTVLAYVSAQQLRLAVSEGATLSAASPLATDGSSSPAGSREPASGLAGEGNTSSAGSSGAAIGIAGASSFAVGLAGATSVAVGASGALGESSSPVSDCFGALMPEWAAEQLCLTVDWSLHESSEPIVVTLTRVHEGVTEVRLLAEAESMGGCDGDRPERIGVRLEQQETEP